MAYLRCKIRPDNEPALVNMTEKIVAECKTEFIQIDLEPPVRYSSQSLGSVGKFQDTHQKQIRTMRTDIETLYGIKVDPSMTIWPWLVRHANWLIERFLVRANGATSYEDCYGFLTEVI